MTEDGFSLDPRLERDTIAVGVLPLNAVRLMNDARFPWLILVPKRAGLSDLIDIASADQDQMHREMDACARALRAETGCDKLNIASLGNMVRQLHVHVIARFSEDAAWPAPVWGVGASEAYEPKQAATLARLFWDRIREEAAA